MSDAFTDERTYRGTRLPVEQATTLVPAAYTSPEFFAVEREKVFATSWVAVGCTGDLDRPGACLVVDVAGRSVVVTRNRRGRLRAFHNVCRHRGTKLLDGDARHVGRHDRIRCPYHGWAYDLDGACLGTPLFERDPVAAFETSVDRADFGLLEVAVEAWGFLVFVCLDPNADPLAHQLGDLPSRFAGYELERWVPRRRGTYEIAANHKLVGENFMEYYHLPWVHPELSKVSKVDDHHRWQGPGMYTGMCTRPISANTEAGGWDGLPPLPGLDGDDAISGRFVWLFPNTGLSVLPNHAFLMLVRPIAPGRTTEETVLLTPPGSEADGDPAALDQLEEFWDLVNRQDIAIVERVQEGLANPAYPGGRMCYRFEEPLHRFQNMVVDRMVGLHRVPDGDDAGVDVLHGPDVRP